LKAVQSELKETKDRSRSRSRNGKKENGSSEHKHHDSSRAEVAQGLVQGRRTMGTDHLGINDMILVNVIHPENKKVPQETGGSHHQDGILTEF
jgi:hypothetical protein